MILRAPGQHGEILALPPLEQVGALLQANQHILSDPSHAILGRPLTDLRSLARREAVPSSSASVWILAGHQPELFHPGVWFKNFALHQLAVKHEAMPLNLIVDTDAAKAPLLHVPAGEHLGRVPFDRAVTDAPYEERIVEDEAMFADVPNRVAAFAANWPFEPMLPAFWQDVMREASRTSLLGERFAAARRAVERRWGMTQDEVPMSRLCQTEAFAYFACAILDRLPAFHETYNRAVREYRAAHGIRNRHQPVPELTRRGDWLETPFWAWRRGQSKRGKLFARLTADTCSLKLDDLDGPMLPAGRGMIDAWRELESAGIKVRTRALTTTMFARVFLGDLFIHGIGGGIYDELTDRILEAHFSIPAPAYLVLSATLLLPLERHPDAADRIAGLSQRLRELTYKPERFCESPLAADKLDWIARQPPTHAGRIERFHRIRALNARMQPLVTDPLERTRAELAECERLQAVDDVARRRDYAFCLFPEAMLRDFYRRSVT